MLIPTNIQRMLYAVKHLFQILLLIISSQSPEHSDIYDGYFATATIHCMEYAMEGNVSMYDRSNYYCSGKHEQIDLFEDGTCNHMLLFVCSLTGFVGSISSCVIHEV